MAEVFTTLKCRSQRAVDHFHCPILGGVGSRLRCECWCHTDDRCVSTVQARTRHRRGVDECKSPALRRNGEGKFLTYQGNHWLGMGGIGD